MYVKEKTPPDGGANKLSLVVAYTFDGAAESRVQTRSAGGILLRANFPVVDRSRSNRIAPLDWRNGLVTTSDALLA